MTVDIVRLIKKHSALLLPIGIALTAVLLFVPALLAGKSVRSQMQESVSIGEQIDSLAGSTVSANQYRVEQTYQQAHASDANAITKLIQQASQRELLVYGMFPEPNETSSIIFTNFGKTYRKAIEDTMAGMRGRDCPSEAEIAEVVKHGAGDYGMGNTAFEAGSHNEAIVEQFCNDRADSIPVYVNPETLSGYDFWDTYTYVGRDEAMEECWKSQIAYWIQKDVVDTIVAMDANSPSVSKSPVKRLVGISFLSEFKSDSSGRRDTAGAADMPRYVTSLTEGILAIPFTGRIGNDTLDVVHFSFSVVVSNKAVGAFMKELCSQKAHTFKGWSGELPQQHYVHNQITILKSSIEPVSRAAGGMGTTDRYRYGDEAVVQLNLICEYLFNKTGYGEIKPKLISEKAAGADAGGASSQPRTTYRPPKSKSGGSKKKSGAGDEGDI
jgi:hypothetical protein